MAKFFGHSAARASLAYIRDNADVIYIMPSANGGAYAFSWTNATASNIVSANISATDFTLASVASDGGGVVMTVGAKTSQAIEGSGTATHLMLGNSSAQRMLYTTTVSAQVLSSGNTVDIGSWTVTVLQSANNA